MSGERALWIYLANGMRGRWHAQRHEDKYASGIPDVSYAIHGVDGWIELKSLSRRPARPEVGLSKIQSAWLTLRGRMGNGNCFVLARFGREHLLFSWKVSGVLTEKQPLSVLYEISLAKWARGIDFNELSSFLGRIRGNTRPERASS